MSVEISIEINVEINIKIGVNIWQLLIWLLRRR
jgi:hypothetical protein